MISREERTPLSEWWWTVDRPLLGAIIALILSGVVLSLAASPPVAARIGLDPFHFFGRHVLFLLPSFMVLIAVSFMSPVESAIADTPLAGQLALVELVDVQPEPAVIVAPVSVTIRLAPETATVRRFASPGAAS